MERNKKPAESSSFYGDLLSYQELTITEIETLEREYLRLPPDIPYDSIKYPRHSSDNYSKSILVAHYMLQKVISIINLVPDVTKDQSPTETAVRLLMYLTVPNDGLDPRGSNDVHNANIPSQLWESIQSKDQN